MSKLFSLILLVESLYCAYDDCSNNGELLVFQVDACICWQFMMQFKVSHLKILWTLLSAISTR
jgi:hypothetical protein